MDCSTPARCPAFDRSRDPRASSARPGERRAPGRGSLRHPTRSRSVPEAHESPVPAPHRGESPLPSFEGFLRVPAGGERVGESPRGGWEVGVALRLTLRLRGESGGDVPPTLRDGVAAERRWPPRRLRGRRPLRRGLRSNARDADHPAQGAHEGEDHRRRRRQGESEAPAAHGPLPPARGLPLSHLKPDAPSRCCCFARAAESCSRSP
jgi:hypothetical protein